MTESSYDFLMRCKKFYKSIKFTSEISIEQHVCFGQSKIALYLLELKFYGPVK